MSAYEDAIERLLLEPVFVIDPLPYRVPKEAARGYFAAEEYLRKSGYLKELYEKFARLLVKLSCYFDFGLLVGDRWTQPASPADLENAVQSGEFRLLVNGDAALLTLDRDDLYLSVYGAEQALQELLCRLAQSEGLFFWLAQEEENTP